MKKPAFCICENKDADQLCDKRTADQRLCFRYIDSTMSLLSISSVAEQVSLCRTWSETPTAGILMTRLIQMIRDKLKYVKDMKINEFGFQRNFILK